MHLDMSCSKQDIIQAGLIRLWKPAMWPLMDRPSGGSFTLRTLVHMCVYVFLKYQQITTKWHMIMVEYDLYIVQWNNVHVSNAKVKVSIYIYFKKTFVVKVFVSFITGFQIMWVRMALTSFEAACAWQNTKTFTLHSTWSWLWSIQAPNILEIWLPTSAYFHL
jgi:hypothetical protein